MLSGETSALSKLGTFVSIVVGVFAASALLGWLLFRAGKSMDSANLDPIYRRRLFALLAGVYVISMMVGVSGVIRGTQPVWSLVCLPIPLLIAYVLLRAASRTKVPPQKP